MTQTLERVGQTMISKERVAGGALVTLLTLGLLVLDAWPLLNDLPLLALTLGIAMGCGKELGDLLARRGIHTTAQTASTAAALAPLVLYGYHRLLSPALLLVVTLAVVIVVLMVALSLISEVARRRRAGVLDFLILCIGGLTIGALLGHVLLLRLLPGGSGLVVLLFFAVWASDFVAFFVGGRWGARKLWPAVSPAKTVEGSLAGLAASLAVFAIYWALRMGLTPLGSPGLGLLLALGLAVGIVAQVGDLAESRLKRWAGVKDSGQAIPGHGGFLDRFDSLLLSAPALFWVLALVVR